MADANQKTGGAMGNFVKQSPLDYQTVAASQTAAVLGAKGGAIGDLLQRVVIVVATANAAATSVNDGGGSEISLIPNSPGGGVGVYVIELGIASKTGAWKVTTGSGVSVIACGLFS